MQKETSAGTFRFAGLENPQQGAAFLNMTYRSYSPLLLGLAPTAPGVAVGAWTIQPDGTEEPVGLALAQIPPEDGPTQVVSLFVNPPVRGQHVATNLLAHLETALVQRGVTHVFGVYPSGKETTPYLERALAARGWSEPRPRMYLFQATRASLDATLKAPWVKPAEVSPEYTVFSWRDLTPEDRAALERGLATGIFPIGLSPFSEESAIDLDVSIGLRYQGELYGYMICHRVGQDMIRYTALFVRTDIPHKGIGLRLFGDSLYRHLMRDRDSPNIAGCWGILASNPFAGFVQRRILQHIPDATFSLTQEVDKLLVPVP